VDRRWALTVWFIADKKSGIIRATDAAIEEKHFGSTAQVGKGYNSVPLIRPQVQDYVKAIE
jgi:hypothetical protein